MGAVRAARHHRPDRADDRRPARRPQPAGPAPDPGYRRDPGPGPRPRRRFLHPPGRRSGLRPGLCRLLRASGSGNVVDRWSARTSSRRRCPDRAHPHARRRSPADGLEPRRARIHRGAGTARTPRPQLRRPDTRLSPWPPTSPTASPWASSSKPTDTALANVVSHPPVLSAAECRADSDRALVPIEDYGLLGDTRTAALVGSDGSIDWLCIPRFDGQPVFGRLIGGPAAGSFRLGPAHRATVLTRRYRPESATLETTWATDGGRLTLTEGMVAEVSGQLLPSTMLVRRLTAEGGPVQAIITFNPRLGDRHRDPQGPAPRPRSWSAAGPPSPSRCGRPPPSPSSPACPARSPSHPAGRSPP